MNSIPTSLELLKNSCTHIDNALTKDLKLAHKSSESILSMFGVFIVLLSKIIYGHLFFFFFFFINVKHLIKNNIKNK